MRTSAVAAAACAFVTSAARPALAQVISHADGDRYRSPQRFALELRFGPYLPDVDSEFPDGQHPYQDYFGGSKRLMSQVELDYQLSHRFGSAAIGLAVGYFSESARAFLTDSAGKSADRTTLRLVPLALSFVYRFDLPARATSFPLVPFAKLGLDYVYWTVTDGNGAVAKDGGSAGSGRGGTAGWHAGLGLALLLDVFDPGAARALDAEVGVNHTYLFVEGAHYDASGLGRTGKLRVGDTTWFGGLLFEL